MRLPTRSRWMLLALVLCAGACTSLSPPAPGAASPSSSALQSGLRRADSLVAVGVDSLYAGAVLAVTRDGVVVFEKAYGYAEQTDAAGNRLAQPRKMETATLFDLASVTKVMATTMAVMVLVDRGEVDVAAPVARYLPAFSGPRRDSITVEHLLRHTAGLAQWQPLYYRARTPAEAFDAIRAMPLRWGVGSGRHYSDLGFMLLGYLVEEVSGQPLDVFVREALYAPLGLASTAFTPRGHGFRDFAATETGNAYEKQMVYDSTFGYRVPLDPASWDGWRTAVLDGEANDGNAFYAHGGVAGHAGLFSTARELSVLLDLLLDGGVHDGHRYLDAHTIDRFLTAGADGHFLGWQHPANTPPGTFAHSGFTGTYVAGIPAHGLSVVLLTNRQHMGRDADGYFPDLRALQTALLQTLVDATAAARE